MAECKATLSDEVAVIATADERLFLVNKGAAAVQVGPGEIFGFGLGAFEEKALGALSAILRCFVGWLNFAWAAT